MAPNTALTMKLNTQNLVSFMFLTFGQAVSLADRLFAIIAGFGCYHRLLAAMISFRETAGLSHRFELLSFFR